MSSAILLSAVFFAGQVKLPDPEPVEVLPPLMAPPALTASEKSLPEDADKSPADSDNGDASITLTSYLTHVRGTNAGHRCTDCKISCFTPWKCKDLVMKPADRDTKCCNCRNLFFCPSKTPAKNECPDKKDGPKSENDSDKGASDAKPADDNEADEEPDLDLLMQVLNCHCPLLFDKLDCCKAKIYGWLEMGFMTNYHNPPDNRLFTLGFASRANDLMLNQAYYVIEKPLDLDKRAKELHFGFRVDFLAGHDAPDFENINLGLWPNFTSNRLNKSSGGYSPDANEFGLSLPQFYVDTHLPILTDRGIDVRVGRFYTLMGVETYPPTLVPFYSRSLENYYGTPFTHLGVMATTHLGDTVDWYNAVVRSWDVTFQDYNDVLEYMGGITWTSCNKRNNVAVNYIFGPEPSATSVGQNGEWRSLITAYYTRLFGRCDEWKLQTGGNVAWQPGASAQPNGFGNYRSAEWYGYCTYLFYTIDPRLVLGARGEWFRDDDGFRTGYADSYWNITLGLTWKPYRNLRIRPEVRWDWANNLTPFNGGTRSSQFASGVDVIWEF